MTYPGTVRHQEAVELMSKGLSLVPLAHIGDGQIFTDNGTLTSYNVP